MGSAFYGEYGAYVMADYRKKDRILRIKVYYCVQAGPFCGSAFI